MEKDKTTYKILIAEDNPGDYFLVEDYLEEKLLTPHIIRTQSFKELKAYIENEKLDFHVLFLDLTLPDMKGKELINEVVSLLEGEVPIIILTGFSDLNFAAKSLSMGISDYIIKDDLTATTLYKSMIYNIERNKNLSILKESEKRYADLFHLNPQPNFVYEAETLAFLDVNEAAIKHYGYTKAEFLSMTILDIRPKEDVDDFLDKVEASRKNNGNDFEGIFNHQRKNGEVFNIEVKSRAITYMGKKAKIVLVNDVTERLKHIQAIEQQNKKLRDIAWTQSHIVRAPLARIMGLTKLISDQSTSPEEKEKLMKHIENSATELDGVIKEIVYKTQDLKLDSRNEP